MDAMTPDPATPAGAVALGCPFCGRKPYVDKVREPNCQLHGEKQYGWRAMCRERHAIFEHFHSRDDAIAAWNTRAPRHGGREPMTACPDGPDEAPLPDPEPFDAGDAAWDDPYEFEDDDYDPEEECGRWINGRLGKLCRHAGSEFCDWECPYSR